MQLYNHHVAYLPSHQRRQNYHKSIILWDIKIYTFFFKIHYTWQTKIFVENCFWFYYILNILFGWRIGHSMNSILTINLIYIKLKLHYFKNTYSCSYRKWYFLFLLYEWLDYNTIRYSHFIVNTWIKWYMHNQFCTCITLNVQ